MVYTQCHTNRISQKGIQSSHGWRKREIEVQNGVKQKTARQLITMCYYGLQITRLINYLFINVKVQIQIRINYVLASSLKLNYMEFL